MHLAISLGSVLLFDPSLQFYRASHCHVYELQDLSGQHQTGGLSMHIDCDVREELQLSIIDKLQQELPGWITMDKKRLNMCVFNRHAKRI